MRTARTLLVSATLITTAAACTGKLAKSATVGQLLERPASYDGQLVRVHGIVDNVLKLPFIEAKFFTLVDSGRALPIVTYDALPSNGERVTIRGTFAVAATFGPQRVGPHVIVGKPHGANGRATVP